MGRFSTRSKKSFIVLLFGLTTLLSSSNTAHSEEERSYFHSLVDDWKFNFVTEETDPGFVTKITTEEKIIFFFVESEELMDQILIDKPTLSIEYFDFVDPASEKQAYYYRSYSEGELELYIPKRYVIYKNESSKLKDYFVELSKTINGQTQPSSNTQTQKPEGIISSEFLLYGLVILSLLIAIGISFKNTENQVESSLSKYPVILGLYRNIHSVLVKVRPHVISYLFISIFIASQIFFLINYLDIKELGLQYIYSHFTKISGQGDVDISIVEGKLIKIGVYVTLQIMGFIMLVLALPNILSYLLTTANKIYHLKLPTHLRHLTVPMLFSGLVLFIFTKDIGYYMLASYLTIMASALFLLLMFKTNKISPFSKNVKSIYLIGLVVCISFFVYQNLVDTKKDTITINRLFDSDSHALFYPYYQNLKGSKPAVTLDVKLSGSKPIFANNYLIYHPGYNVIKNQNKAFLDQTTNDDLIIIGPSNHSDMLKELVTNESLLPYYIGNTPTPVMYVDYGETHQKNVNWLYINATCGETVGRKTIDLEIIGFDTEQTKHISNKTGIANFEGCNQNDTFELTVPVYKDVITNRYIFNLLNIDGININEFSILDEFETSRSMTYISYDPNNRYKFIEKSDSAEIVSISLENIVPTEFDNTMVNESIDITQNVNKIIQQSDGVKLIIFDSIIPYSVILDNLYENPQ